MGSDLCNHSLRDVMWFCERQEEFARLTAEAHALEERISANVAALLEAE